MKILFALFLTATATYVCAQTHLEVTIKNIKEQKGNIRIGVFNNEKDFLKKAVEAKVVKASASVVTVSFTDLQPGEYALSVFHDENENDKLDSNLFGIPKEGFGFGNNAMGTFGPPSFEKAKIVISIKPLKHEITLKYY